MGEWKNISLKMSPKTSTFIIPYKRFRLFFLPVDVVIVFANVNVADVLRAKKKKKHNFFLALSSYDTLSVIERHCRNKNNLSFFYFSFLLHLNTLTIIIYEISELSVSSTFRSILEMDHFAKQELIF